MGAAWMVGTALVATAGSTAYSANQQHEAANTAARAQKRALKAMPAEANQEHADTDALRNQRALRQRMASGGLSGRQGTIMTGPIGIPGEGAVPRKRLLGE